MNKKLVIIFLAALIVIAALAYLAYASPAIGFTYNTPTNGSTQFPEIGGVLNFSISTNESFNTSCELMWNNNGTLFAMSNMSAANTSWQLNFNIPAANRTAINNARYRCGNTTPLKEWSNATSILYFWINDNTYTIQDLVVVNNSILSGIPKLNISMNNEKNATNCTFNYNAAGEQSALMGQSPNRRFWSNASALSWSDSSYGAQHNISYNCTDSAGNYSGSGLYFFKLDTAAPTFPATPVFSSIGNKSTGGNYITITANTTDANAGYCGASLYYGSDIRRNVSREVSFNSSANNANCTVNITPSDIAEDGYVEITPFVKDVAGNENVSSTNQSYIIYRLKTGWNVVTGYENKTLSQIAAEFTNVTYVSVFDNQPTMKNFTTFTVGGSTNSGVGSNHSANYSYGAAYVYVNADVVSMRRYYALPSAWTNATLWTNSTVGKPTWNLVGVTKQLTNLNTTMMQNVCTNTTGAIVGTNCANLTWFSFYSIQDGKFCSFYRNRLATSCSLTTAQYNLTRGDALWIAVQNTNVILMRGSWS